MATDRAHAFALLVILALLLLTSRKGPSAGLTLGAASFACGSRHTQPAGGRNWCSPASHAQSKNVAYDIVIQNCVNVPAAQSARSWTSFGGVV